MDVRNLNSVTLEFLTSDLTSINLINKINYRAADNRRSNDNSPIDFYVICC